jgi:tetratricopeptide (TPR) repeat protein
MAKVNGTIGEAIALTQAGDYLHALTRFVEVYGSEGAPAMKSAKDAAGLSYFGLSLALVQKKYKEGIDLCKRALDLEFYNGDHYVNMAKIYLARGDRKKAVETADAGLKVAPEHRGLATLRKELGVRARPAVPFLDRSNPVNVTLGQARHAAKEASEGRTKKK